MQINLKQERMTRSSYFDPEFWNQQVCLCINFSRLSVLQFLPLFWHCPSPQVFLVSLNLPWSWTSCYCCWHQLPFLRPPLLSALCTWSGKIRIYWECAAIRTLITTKLSATKVMFSSKSNIFCLNLTFWKSQRHTKRVLIEKHIEVDGLTLCNLQKIINCVTTHMAWHMALQKQSNVS